MSEQYKKFGELSRDEQLKLVEYALDGGEVEIFSGTAWYNTEGGKQGVVCFYKAYCYRKLKSELDLLKEQRDELDKKIGDLEGGISVGDAVIKKFDASKREYRVFKSNVYEIPYNIGGTFYSKDQVNDQFIKVQQ